MSIVFALGVSPAQAAPAWERDYAVKTTGISNSRPCTIVMADYQVTRGDNATASACYAIKGDYMKAIDGKADGKAAVMKWEYFPNQDAAVKRRGVCIYTGGSTAPYRAGTCNKDLPEKGLIRIWAGVRNVSGSTSLHDMTFGPDYVCLAFNGSKAVGYSRAGCEMALNRG
ncbi:hypothetical protein [Aeromicrobium duanguangcaii]|uniref:hypothetical protein n=1 Tax=Aeromicrobium duanguangcaii TaxID=2968086 RepID=UPI002017EC97|nr:hypothetical protein [Aeromicrobium duanguangcaii]MCL3837398.1 hypothetical protein [Aeromicrobium duanguangcaii]